MNTDLKNYYETNENFRAYVDGMRRIHPELSVDDVLEKLMVKEVAQFYQEREEQ